MKYILLLIALFTTATSISQEPLIFNRSRPIEIATSSDPIITSAYVPGVYFVESNANTPGYELFVGGEYLVGEEYVATARTYKKVGENWVTDMDFGDLPTKRRFEKAQLGGSEEDDLVIVGTDGIRIFFGSPSGSYDEIFVLDEDLFDPAVTSFDYELDGDMDVLVSENFISSYWVIQNNGDGTFTPLQFNSSKFTGVIEAGLIGSEWYIASQPHGGSGSMTKLNADGVTFEFEHSTLRSYRYSTITYADFRSEGVNMALFSGNVGSVTENRVHGFDRDIDAWRIIELMDFPSVARGDIDILDFNDDGFLDVVAVGQENLDGGQTFEIKYGSGEFEYSGLSQKFTDENGDLINFSRSSLDVVKEDGIFKILVSGNGCYPDDCIEAFLFTQVDCNDSLWYEDTDGDGFGDNYSVVCAVDQPEDYVSDNTDVFPNDENEWADQDGDGLGDNADQCDDTPEGDPIDEFGCSTILSVNSTDLNEELKLYPNPAQNQITIELPFEDSEVTITVYNMLGQIVSRSEKFTFNVSGLAKGHYIVKVESATRVNIARFIKN